MGTTRQRSSLQQLWLPWSRATFVRGKPAARQEIWVFVPALVRERGPSASWPRWKNRSFMYEGKMAAAAWSSSDTPGSAQKRTSRQRPFNASVPNLLEINNWLLTKSLDVPGERMLDIVTFAETWRTERVGVPAETGWGPPGSGEQPTSWKSLL